MLCALIVMGYGGSRLLRHGHTTLPAYREHLNYRGTSFQRNRVNPYRSPQTWGRKPWGGQWRCGYGSAKGSECCAVIAQIEVASPVRDNITSPETEQTFRRCSHSRPFMEPMQEAKQMTTAQAVGAASHTPGEFSIAVRIGCKPVSRRSYLHLNKTASSFVMGALLSARAV